MIAHGGRYRALVDRLTADIAAQRYRTDEILPRVGELSKRFGVGEFAVRHALRTMAKEGLLRLVPHVGAVVCKGQGRAASFRIAYYGVNVGGYAVETVINRLRRHFTAAGCDFVVISPPSASAGSILDVSALERELDRGIDYVIAGIGCNRQLERLDRRKIPYAVLDCFTGLSEKFPKADAHFVWNGIEASRKVIAALKRAGVGRILEVDLKRSYEKELSRRLTEAGFRVRRIWSDPPLGNAEMTTQALMRAVYADLVKCLRNFRTSKERPDAIVFMDDYAARGGFAALMESGLRVPDDVKMVTHVNVGNEPFFPRRLTRWEFDFGTAADRIASWTLARLRGKRQRVPSIAVRFVRGETL